MAKGADEEPDAQPPGRTPATMAAAVVLLLAGGLAVGVVPAFVRGVGAAAGAFVDQRGYMAAALTQPLAARPAVPDTTWTTGGVLTGLGTVALAVGIAFAGLYVRSVPALLRSTVATLHRLHSGHIGDYAAWLILGTAAFAGLLLLG